MPGALYIVGHAQENLGAFYIAGHAQGFSVKNKRKGRFKLWKKRKRVWDKR